jgi:hypothetical protein
MSENSKERLAAALEAIAKTIASTPTNVTGMRVSGGHGQGPAVVATANISAPLTGNVSALHVQTTVGGPSDELVSVIAELREAAAAVREDKAAKSWVSRVLGRVTALAGHAVDGATIAAATKLVETVLS